MPYILRPYPEPGTEADKAINHAPTKTRAQIEMTFAQLKSRFYIHIVQFPHLSRETSGSQIFPCFNPCRFQCLKGIRVTPNRALLEPEQSSTTSPLYAGRDCLQVWWRSNKRTSTWPFRDQWMKAQWGTFTRTFISVNPIAMIFVWDRWLPGWCRWRLAQAVRVEWGGRAVGGWVVSSRGAGPQEWSGHTGKREKLDLSASEWTLRKLLNTYIIKTLR